MRRAGRLDEAVTLSAQHLISVSTEVDEGVLVFIVSDGEQAVEIGHEIGSAEQAAVRFDALAVAAAAHAERIRAAARARRQQA